MCECVTQKETTHGGELGKAQCGPHYSLSPVALSIQVF